VSEYMKNKYLRKQAQKAFVFSYFKKWAYHCAATYKNIPKSWGQPLYSQWCNQKKRNVYDVLCI